MFKKNRVLIRIIFSHLLSGALLTALLLFAVSGIVTSRIEASTDRSERALLRQTYQTTDFILSDIYNDFYSLWTRNAVITQTLSMTGAAPGTEQETGSILATAALNDEPVHSVQLINLDTGMVYSDHAGPMTIDRMDDPGALELLQDFDLRFNEYKDDVFFPRTVEAQGAGSNGPIELLSIIFASKSGDGTIHSGLIVNIDRQRLASLIRSEQISGMLLMVSPTGRLIANLSDTVVPMDFSGDTAIRSILNGSAEEGSLTENFLGEKTFLIFRKANALGFTFIRALPYAALQMEAQATNRIVASLFIAAMLISLITSAFTIWMIYHPLNRLVRRMRSLLHTSGSRPQDEYSYLQSAYTALYGQSRQSGLIRLIYGQIDPTVLLELRLDRPRFFTFAMMPDQMTPDDRFIRHIFEQAEGISGWHAVLSAPDCVSIVMNEDDFDDNRMEQLLTHIGDFQTAVGSQMGVTFSVGLGTVVEGAAAVRTSHRLAMAAVQQALTMGKNQLISYAEIENGRTTASHNRSAVTATIDAYIQDHLSQSDLTPEEIASHVGLSVGYMRQIFRLERGVPINDYLTTCRIAKAQLLLATTDLTAKRIAEEVGYADTRYFYTLFKKKTGETTEEYRQRTRQNDPERV